ncbi:MAG: V-type ATPase subunit [Erysipelotrichaceae bacterium]|nr:V-type ATPase subunit [Erysipelotrichaceae bacterium]
MAFSDNALIAKIKTLHARDLKEEDYQELLKKKTVYDVAVYLKKHDAYKDILANIPEATLTRSRIEGLIKRQRFNQTIKLVKFFTSKDKPFYMFDLIRMEHEVILAMIRSFISKDVYDVVAQIPFYFDHYSKIDFVSLTKARDMETLINVLQNTRYYKILKNYAKKKNDELRYYEFESIFENDYYDYAFKQIKANYKGQLKKTLDEAFKARIEMENMIKVYRLKKFYGIADSDIKAILIPSTRILENKIDEIIAIKDPNDIFKAIVESGVGPYLGSKDQVYLEYFTDHLRFNIARKFMYYSNSAPTIFLAYIFYGELEIENLTHIIEGIHYQMSEQEIRSMLVF